MKKETADNTKIYIGVIAMSIFILCTILLWIKLTIGFSKDYTVALIGFFGSIIGGVVGGIITLQGVKMTILNQTTQEAINKYPERLLLFYSLESKINKMDRTIRNISNESENYGFIVGQTVQLARRWLEESLLEDLKVESSKISVLVFEKIIMLESHIDNFVFFNDEQYGYDERSESVFFEYLDYFEKLLYEILEEKYNLSEKYEKFNNIY
ncbi:MAG: hypothetical protein JWM44_4222 [Bacilli bacterium]|nr:hypothetical protein [Bacilli bacterium]